MPTSTLMKKHIDSLRLDGCQRLGRVAVLPLGRPAEPGPAYRTLAEAMAMGSMEVTEVSEGGSVPELAVLNKGDLPVLILDGEEVRGAKQNRVLNTSILVGAGARVIVPVSCTERGRWHYRSRTFEDSEVVMPRAARVSKLCAVSATLRQGAGFAGDQGEVWDSVDEIGSASGTFSETGALRDFYSQNWRTLEEQLVEFPALAGQAGLLVLVDGRAVGMDVLSRPEAYARVHARLLRSYLADALIAGLGQRRAESATAGAEPAGRKAGLLADAELEARGAAFLRSLPECQVESYPSRGLGTDLRFGGPGLVGSALEHEGTLLHVGFLAQRRRERPDFTEGPIRGRGGWLTGDGPDGDLDW